MKKMHSKSLMISIGLLSCVCVSVSAFVEPVATAPGGNVAGPLTAGSSAQTKEGALTVNNNGSSTEGLIVQEGDFLVRDGIASFSNGSYSDPHDNGSYDAKFGGSSRGVAVRGTSYFADKIGLGDQSPDGSLLLDVNGQVGATEFCDENGANCVSITDVGGGAIDDLDDGVSDDSSVFLGLNSGNNDNRSENYNVGVGVNALLANTTGYGNTALGESALRGNTTGYLNTAIGVDSLYLNTNGLYNIAIGEEAMRGHNGGSNNIGIGTRTLFGANDEQLNIAIGYEALYSNTGSNNTGIGFQALKSGNGSFNAAMGDRSMFTNGSGEYNVSVGADAMYDNTNGDYNVAVGYQAMSDSENANQNVAVGYYAGQSFDSGQGNLFIGNRAGDQFSSGDYNIAIGDAAQLASNNGDYQLNIGDLITGVTYGNKYVTIKGNTTCTIGNGSGNTACTSDERLKENIAPLENALDRVRQLDGVSYTWKERLDDGEMIGVIAQNVESVFPEMVHESTETGYKSVEYATLVAPLIESVKELADRVEALESENEDQKKKIKELESLN